MNNVHYETGTITELGESRSYGNGRFYTHIELRDDNDKVVRLQDVNVSLDASPRIAIGNKVTIGFTNAHGRVITHKNHALDTDFSRSFKNVIVAVGCGNELSIDRGSTPNAERLVNMFMIAGVIALLGVVFLGWSYFFLAVPAVFFFKIGPMFMAMQHNKRVLKSVREEMNRLGFVDPAGRVYS